MLNNSKRMYSDGKFQKGFLFWMLMYDLQVEAHGQFA